MGSSGASGTDGMNGLPGAPGLPGTNGSTGTPGAPGPSTLDLFNIHAELPEVLNVALINLDMGSSLRAPVVSFRVTDGIGRGAVGFRAGSGGHLRFAIAKLTPGINGVGTSGEPSFWTNYIKSNGRPTAERSGRLVDNRDGSYAYTFSATVAASPVYDASMTHRLTIQLSGTLSGETVQTPIGPAPPVNFSHDFVPAGGPVTASREIVDVASCNSCHGKLQVHGARFETKYCVMCHNPDLVDRNGNSVDMKVFIHKIHYSANLPSVRAGQPYELAGDDYSETTLPLEVKNCRKCHDGDPTADHRTPDGNHWREFPSKQACGACHDDIDWTLQEPAPGAHPGGPQPDNSLCTVCHGATTGLAPIERLHLTDASTPHNPRIPVGLSKFAYEIRSVSLDATDHPIVAFRVMRDTGAGPVSMDFAGTALPTSPVTTGGPSFLLAYTVAQDGIAQPGDYAQVGRTASQPLSVSLANLRAGTAGTITATTGGFWVATFGGTNAFPAGAQMRAVAMQSYFSENLPSDSPDRGAIGRHTPSVVTPVRGDRVRREVVADAKCAGCHEQLEGHGGQRVANTAVCVICHNPNLTSSGRGVDPVLLQNQASNVGSPSPEAREQAMNTIAAFGADPLQFPEASNNFKDLVHGIHGARPRSNAFQFVRDRGNSGIFAYDWSDVTFPNIDGNCNACHLPGSYRVAFSDSALPTTERVTLGAADARADVVAARSTVPNPSDLVTSAKAAACSGCHDSPLAQAHMGQNGGAVGVPRALFDASSAIETCALCHGPGRLADIDAAHPIFP